MSERQDDERQPLLESQNGGHADHQTNGKQDVVEFDAKGDEENPLEWTSGYRWIIVALMCFMAITVTFTCIGIVPVAGSVIEELEGHKDKSASVLFVTIWELGEAAGPLFIAPLSEIFGRYPVYNGANILFIVGTIMSALSQNVHLLMFSRFLTGCAVASNVLNPAICGDMFPSSSRGKAMSAVMLAPLIGGAIGPSVAGVVAQSAGWRAVNWMAVGLAGFCELVFLLFFRETYKVTILRRRAANLRKETGDQSYKTEWDADMDNPWKTIALSMLRPAKVIWSSVVLQMLSVWGALIFTFFYIMSTTLPDMLQEIYDFDPATTGVSFLSFSLGSMSGILVCNLFVDRLYVSLEKKHGSFYPEGRLPLPIIASFAMGAVVAYYGAAAAIPLPAWALLIAVVLIGVCVVLGIVPMMTYVTDAFGIYSASALTAVLILRCLAGTFLPLIVPPLADEIGYGWGFLCFAGACFVMAPIPILVFRYGPKWRQRSSYSKEE